MHAAHLRMMDAIQPAPVEKTVLAARASSGSESFGLMWQRALAAGATAGTSKQAATNNAKTATGDAKVTPAWQDAQAAAKKGFAKSADAEEEDATAEQTGQKGEAVAVGLSVTAVGSKQVEDGVRLNALPVDKGMQQATNSKAARTVDGSSTVDEPKEPIGSAQVDSVEDASVEDTNVAVEAIGAARIQPGVVASGSAKEMEKPKTSGTSPSLGAGGKVETKARALDSRAPSIGVESQLSAVSDRLSAKRMGGESVMDASSSPIKAKRGPVGDEAGKSAQDGSHPIAETPEVVAATLAGAAAVGVVPSGVVEAVVVAPAEAGAAVSAGAAKGALPAGARGRAAVAGEPEKDGAKIVAAANNEMAGDDATATAIQAVTAVSGLQQAGIAVGHATGAGSGSVDLQVSQAGVGGVGAAAGTVSGVGHAGAVHAGAEIQNRALDAGTFAQSAGAQGPQLIAAGPTRLEVGTLDGTHGWVQVRAELGTGGDVRASLTGSAAAHEALRAAVPGLAGYLQTEAVSVSGIAVHRAAGGNGAGLTQNGGGASGEAQSGRGQGQGGDSGGSGKNSSAGGGYGSRSEANQIVGAGGASSDFDETGASAAARFTGGGLLGFTGGDSGNWVSVTV